MIFLVSTSQNNPKIKSLKSESIIVTKNLLSLFLF